MKEIELVVPRKKKRKAVKILTTLQIKNYRIVNLDHKYKIEFLITNPRVDEVINKIKTELEIGKSVDEGMILISDKKMVAPFTLEKETMKDPEHDIIERARNAANTDKNHILFLALSTIIAVIGLQTNHALVIFGALLIAPMMDPILANCYGIVKKRKSIIKNSSKTLTLSIYIVIIIAFAVPILTFKTDITNEMMMRTTVDPTDLLLAVVIGAIAALAFASNKSTMLIGVAAAISLMPPLANAGILLLLGIYELSFKSFTLFVVNFLGMYAGSTITFIILEYDNFRKKLKKVVKKTKS
ncbi:MAG: TIGR00341 family protein [Nanoarchaeota archaeon]|nr:TIGR00341 family protein [Nanoarchaeota archaeon]